MSNQVDEQPVGFFEELMAKTDDDIRRENLELARKALQRRFQSAHDDAQSQILNHRTGSMNILDRMRKDPLTVARSFDVNAFIAAARVVAELESSMATIAAEYLKFFGEPIR